MTATAHRSIRDNRLEQAAEPRAGYAPSARFVLLMGMMVAIGAVSSDIYLPSLPAVADELTTSMAAAQFTISAVLVGAGLGQLIMGPLSDRFGRRRPALIGIALHVAASLLCMLAPSVGILIGLRMVQGIGNAAATVTALAIIRDRLVGASAARVLSRLVLVIGVVPLLAPALGGAVAGIAGWRAVFAVLALIGAVLWVLVWRFLPETLPEHARAARGVRGALQGYAGLLRDRGFMALALLPGLVFSGIMSYVVAAPFVLQVGYELTEHQFVAIFAMNATSGMITSQVNAALMRRFEPMSVLRIAMPALVVLGAAVLVVAATGAGGLVGLLVALWLLLGGFMFVPPNATAVALGRHGERAGSAAALVGALQVGIAGLVSPMVGLLGGDATAMALTILGALTTGLVVLAVGTRAYRRDPRGATDSASRPADQGQATNATRPSCHRAPG